MKKTDHVLAWAFCLVLAESVFSAPEYIANFSSFPAYPYNTSAYKQGGAFVGCGPTAGAMMFGYFQTVYPLTNLLTNPGTGVDKGLNTAWTLHASAYMNTGADGFGSVLYIKPGLENYAADKGFTLKVLIHVSPAYTSPNATFDAYGPYGDAWTNDAAFWQQKADNSWKIDPAAFCDFLKPKLDAGIPIFLTIDSDGNGSGDHWVALVGFDRATGKYAFYNTYTTTLQWADIYYVLDSSGPKVNSISYIRTVALSLPDIASSPATGSYGSVTVGGYQEKTLTISNAGTAVLIVTAVSLTGTNASEFSIRSGGGAFTLAPGATRNLVVRFSPATAGSKSANLSIASNDPDENPFPIALSGTGTATAVPDIASNTAVYSFGSADMGSTKEYTFIISNAGTSNLNVSAVTVTGTHASEFTVQSGGGAFTLAPGATRNLVVRFAPSTPGNKTAAVSIASNDPDENPFLITLVANGNGPDIAVDPNSKDFGSISVGGSQEKTVSIYNVGSADLIVTAVTLTGTHASEFSIQSGGSAFTLAASGTPHDIVVRFTPASAGAKSASLSIACNDFDENPFVIALSGTGTSSGGQNNPPTDLAALNGFDGAVPLAWKAPSGVPAENPVRGYHIYRGTLLMKPLFLGTTSNTYYRDATASNKTAYTYTVKAVYGAGESVASNTAQGQAKLNGTVVQSAFTTSPPSINGVLGLGEWNGEAMEDILNPGGAGQVTFYVLNDASYLYVAVDDKRDPAVHTNDTFGLFFDENRDLEWPSSFPSTEGLLQLFWNGEASACSYMGAKGTWPGSISGDAWAKPTGVTQALSAVSGHVQYEGRISLSAFLQAKPGESLGMFLYVWDGKTETFHGAWPQETASKLPAYTTGYGWCYGPFAYGELRLASSTAVQERKEIPDRFTLEQNYPNPFNPVTTISYSVPAASPVRMSVRDAMGREVAVPVNGMQPAGTHRVTFDGKNLNSGMYFCTLESGGRILTHKMILLK